MLEPGEAMSLDMRLESFRRHDRGETVGADAGSDIAADGNGTVTGERLDQLVRQKDAVRDRTFTVAFLDPGVEAFAFTFG